MAHNDVFLSICPESALPEGSARGFTLEGVNLLVLREGGNIHLYHNRCPHLGIPLEWDPDSFLNDTGDLIRCANHGALFVKDSGECIQGPCRGQALLALPCKRTEGELRVARSVLQGLA